MQCFSYYDLSTCDYPLCRFALVIPRHCRTTRFQCTKVFPPKLIYASDADSLYSQGWCNDTVFKWHISEWRVSERVEKHVGGHWGSLSSAWFISLGCIGNYSFNLRLAVLIDCSVENYSNIFVVYRESSTDKPPDLLFSRFADVRWPYVYIPIGTVFTTTITHLFMINR